MKSQGTKVARLGTLLLHADDHQGDLPDVAPAISVTSTFKVPPELSLDGFDPTNPTHHVYSRYTQAVRTRVEQVLSAVCNGYAITYSSGLASVYAALVLLQPKRIAITRGYHGVYASLSIFERSRGQKIPIISLDDDYENGDLCWVETPLNPTGEARDIKYYAEKAHLVGAKVIVDATFAPPPLQDPFKWGADIVMHSGTKYFGGHSDLLSGVLVVKTEDEWKSLWHDRTYMGNSMGSLETWLLLRSLRTLHLRVPKQSATATALVQWLHRLSLVPPGKKYDGVEGGMVTHVWHSSLQATDKFDPKTQLEGGYNATFAILMAKAEWAAALPYTVKYFVPATSLGGVESLMEQRVRSDEGADPRLIRISVGVEDFEDLKSDLKRAFQELASKAKL